MSILNMARRLAKSVTSDSNDFATEVIFSVTNGETVTQATINAIAVQHNVTFDPNTGNNVVNTENARVTVHEDVLNDAEYPVRDTNNRISLERNKVTWTDRNGVQITYRIASVQPNETTGVIVCILSEMGTITEPGRIIIGWTPAKIEIELVDEVDESETIELANGDVIPKQYVVNEDGTITIPYLAGYDVLAGFYLDNYEQNSISYNSSTGTFDGSVFGGFYSGNKIAFNATIPVWQS